MINLQDFLKIPTIEGMASIFYDLDDRDKELLPDAVLTAIHEHKFCGSNGHDRPKSNEHAKAPPPPRSYDDWLAAGEPVLTYEQWAGLPSEEKHQFCVGEIGQLAEDGDWTYEQRQAAERYVVDYEAEHAPSKTFIDARQRGELSDRQVPAQAKRGGDFLAEYEPISYTWGGFLPSSCVYGLTAKTGGGKTALLICGSIAIMKGNDEGAISKVLGCEVERGRVAYITKENPDDFRMKLAANCYIHGIDREFLNKHLLVLDGRSDSPEQICDAMRRDAEHNGLFQLANYDTFQAGYAADPAAREFNENLAPLRFVERLRKVCEVVGKPTVLVGCHPIKNATEDQLIPFGGGSSYNELDGNLTLWKEAAIKLYWTKVRGPQFEPRYFRLEMLSCPDIIDNKGRQILLPVIRPADVLDIEARKIATKNTKLELLREMLAEPTASQRDWAIKIGVSVSTINSHLQALEKDKLVEKVMDDYGVTVKGKRHVAKNDD